MRLDICVHTFFDHAEHSKFSMPAHVFCYSRLEHWREEVMRFVIGCVANGVWKLHINRYHDYESTIICTALSGLTASTVPLVSPQSVSPKIWLLLLMNNAMDAFPLHSHWW